MSAAYTIGIDNGTTGTLAIIGPEGPFFDEIPVKEYLLGKSGKFVRRIDHHELAAMIVARVPLNRYQVAAYVERPFTGSAMMINTTVLSARSHEAVLIVCEQLGIGITTVDSKTWQLPLLGAVKGSPQLKKASAVRGAALYPMYAAQIKKHGDADGLLIAHHFAHISS